MADIDKWLLRMGGRWRGRMDDAARIASSLSRRTVGERCATVVADRIGSLLQRRPHNGRDGFLFHRDRGVFDQLASRIVLDRSQLQIWLNALDRRCDWCRRHDAAMRFLIAPEKHVVYRRHLPRHTTISPHRSVLRLFEAMDSQMRCRALYPRVALEAAGALMPTYFRTDTHWTDYGAFIAYRALVDSLAPDIALESIGEDALLWKPRRFVGDLGVSFEPERCETRFIAAYAWDHDIAYMNHRFERGAVHVYTRPRADLPTCVLFRDSFANFMIPFLMRSFSRLVTVSSLSCHYDLLERERPDVVLFIMVERFLHNPASGKSIEMPRDCEVQSFAEFCETALDDVPPPCQVGCRSLKVHNAF